MCKRLAFIFDIKFKNTKIYILLKASKQHNFFPLFQIRSSPRKKHASHPQSPLPPSRFPLCPRPQPRSSAPVRRHPPSHHRHQGPRVPRFHLQEGSGGERPRQMLFPRLCRFLVRKAGGHGRKSVWDVAFGEDVEGKGRETIVFTRKRLKSLRYEGVLEKYVKYKLNRIIIIANWHMNRKLHYSSLCCP